MVRVHAEAFGEDELDSGVDQVGRGSGHDEHGHEGRD
jgi:hypothetical protein